MKTSFNLPHLIHDVFDPQPGEAVLVMTDVPTPEHPDTPEWADRRAMAAEWREAFAAYGQPVRPLLSYPATGGNNADLPNEGMAGGHTVVIADQISRARIVVAMTTFSATAPLSVFVKANKTLRVASMPDVQRRMEQTALAADYQKVAEQANRLADLLDRAESAVVEFSTGDRMRFDLRHRRGLADDGQCKPGKPFSLINLPSGEAFIVPYEGEIEGDASRTVGTIPVQLDSGRVQLHIEQNRIQSITGEGPQAEALRAYFDADPARCNMAELGLGCNDRAVVTGNVLEDEKAGLHWAYGRSEHLGGTVGPDQFTDPSLVVHTDIVYAADCPVSTNSVTLHYPGGEQQVIMKDNKYILG